LARSYKKSLYSYKFKHSGFRYKIALCIKTGKIVWWNGPYLPGEMNDNMIFEDGLRAMLGPDERAEADAGYSGSAPHWTRVPDTEGPAHRAKAGKVRMRQETCNKRLKAFKIMSTRYRHDMARHQVYFGAILAILQLSFEDEPLFAVDY
jgi:hypothetical protein